MSRKRTQAAHQGFGRASEFWNTYTKGLEAEDLGRLFTRDTRDAYRFFTRHVDQRTHAGLPFHRRMAAEVRHLFLGFALKLSPARRILYGAALVLAIIGFIELFRGFAMVQMPVGGLMRVRMLTPVWANGALALLVGFCLLNLLVLLEVADRLSLKNDLEIAREIQLAMLPQQPYVTSGVEAYGQTRPANTVGGDFYDILALPDGRVIVTLGDVAGKGSPAALLMALLLAMLRTLVDEGLEAAELVDRLNVQISRHAPGSRFITLFYAIYTPATGDLVYVNAGHLPALLRRSDGSTDRLSTGGIALGMFDASTYSEGRTQVGVGDLLVIYSDGITEAEDLSGRPFEETGLDAVVQAHADAGAADIARAIFSAVEAHARDTRFSDDLTALVMRRTEAAAAS